MSKKITPQDSGTIQLNGKPYKARLSFLALKIIKSKLGYNLMNMSNDESSAFEKDLTDPDKAAIFVHALVTSEHPEMELEFVERFAGIEHLTQLPTLMTQMISGQQDAIAEEAEEGAEKGN